MSQHTPGPWRVVPEYQRIGSVDDANGLPVARSQMRGTMGKPELAERRANTRLIAAAPDLLDACRETLAELRAYCGEEEHDAESINGQAMRRLAAAIAKAVWCS